MHVWRHWARCGAAALHTDRTMAHPTSADTTTAQLPTQGMDMDTQDTTPPVAADAGDHGATGTAGAAVPSTAGECG